MLDVIGNDFYATQTRANQTADEGFEPTPQNRPARVMDAGRLNRLYAARRLFPLITTWARSFLVWQTPSRPAPNGR
jgi:hypothetical protein